MKKDIKDIIREIYGVSLTACDIAVKNEKKFGMKADMYKAITCLVNLTIDKMDLNCADGQTIPSRKIIYYNARSSVKWGEKYLKLVLLHELAHYFTHEVSGVTSSHCRT
jgi:Zn-dependent peptidase ImmA (M78 family)